MKRSTLDILCCPVCKADLDLEVTARETGEDGEEVILEGTLRCRQCGVIYPITEGIPDLLPRGEERC